MYTSTFTPTPTASLSYPAASSIVRRSLTLRLTLRHSVLILVDAAAAALPSAASRFCFSTSSAQRMPPCSHKAWMQPSGEGSAPKQSG